MTNIIKKRRATIRFRKAPAKRLRSRAVRIRVLTYLDDQEDARVACEVLKEGGERIPLEQLILQLRLTPAPHQ